MSPTRLHANLVQQRTPITDGFYQREDMIGGTLLTLHVPILPPPPPNNRSSYHQPILRETHIQSTPHTRSRSNSTRHDVLQYILLARLTV
jgi:hypothetical protein